MHLKFYLFDYYVVAKQSEVLYPDDSAKVLGVLLFDLRQNGNLHESLFYQFRRFFYYLQCLKFFQLMVVYLQHLSKRTFVYFLFYLKAVGDMASDLITEKLPMNMEFCLLFSEFIFRQLTWLVVSNVVYTFEL